MLSFPVLDRHQGMQRIDMQVKCLQANLISLGIPLMKNARVCPFLCALFLGIFLSFVSAASAANTLNYQGRVISSGTAFAGSGQFKFALVSADGSTVYWKNDGTTDSAAPTSAVPLTVTKGIFSVRLGDTSVSNMAAISSSVFSNTSMALRIWFNDGVKGFQQLSPDSSVDPSILAAANMTSASTTAKTVVVTTFPIWTSGSYFTPNSRLSFDNIPSNILTAVTVPINVRDSSGRGFDVRYPIERTVKKITKISGVFSKPVAGCQAGIRLIKISPLGVETVVSSAVLDSVGNSISKEVTMNESLSFDSFSYFLSVFASTTNTADSTVTVHQAAMQLEE